MLRLSRLSYGAAGLTHARAIDRVADAAPVCEARALETSVDGLLERLAGLGLELVLLLLRHEVGDSARAPRA
jgi:hypothetical protein